MSRMFAFCLFIAGTAFSAIQATEKVVQSHIDEVTVYVDRAQVSRVCTENLPSGETRIVFDNLPEAIEQQSLRVDGVGNGMVHEVKFRREPVVGNVDSLAAFYHARKRFFEDSVRSVDDQIKRNVGEKQFVENIAAKVTERGATQQQSPAELDNAKWSKMADFYRTRQEELDQTLRAAERLKTTLGDSLSALTKRIANMGKDARAERNQAVVLIEMKEPGRLTLRLSYIVYGPSWSPAYDLRVVTDKKLLRMTYKGVVRQSTGEDWTRASLKLSTAQVQVAGTQPELSPWYVSIYTPPLYRARSSHAMAKSAPAQMMNQIPEEREKKEMVIEDLDAAPLIEVADASVETGATSALFAIVGKSTIASDNQTHTVTILTTDFSAYFRYSSVPKLAPYAYLKAKVTNTTEFPLLPGPTSIFLDNAFVASGTLNLVAPKEDFWTFLGIDEGIKVEYKLINRFQSQDGIVSKRSKVTYEYETIITNNRKDEQEIVVWDQIPITSSEEIRVELLEPKMKENTSTLKKNEQNYLEWYFKVKAGEKTRIPFKFSVDYPQGKTISGL